MSRDGWRERWHSLLRRLGLTDSGEGQLDVLWDAYAQPGRFYHNWSHIAACLELLDQVPELDERDAIELALWYHDAVYDPRASDNEARSCDLALEFLPQEQPVLRKRVESLILVTQHHRAELGSTEAWMVDLDLSILGASPELYDLYETGIRKEYAWVPWFRYRSKRKAILREFDQRRPLFLQPHFQQQRESQAHENLARAIARL